MAVVLVADGEQRAALAVVRSLGAAGHQVYVCSHHASCLAGASRHSRASEQVPNPLEQPTAYVAAVAELVGRWHIDVVVPNTDAALLALLPARDRIDANIPWPSLEAFQNICDKSRVAEAAQTLGIGVPKQLRLESAGGARTAVPSELSYPLVLKPSRSVVASNGKRTKLGVRHVANEEALERELRAQPAEAYPILLQERIEGAGVGVFLLMHDGEVLAAFAHRRMREKPPSGGVSVLRESIALDPKLRDLSVALLRGFAWEGPAMVEYKVDRTGRPYIMEINGRFWGSLQLAIDADVDFPHMLISAATGEHVQPVTSYRTGVRSRWFLGDVDHLLLRLRHSPKALELEEQAPSRAQAVADFIKAFGPTSRSEVFRLSDPAPGLRELVEWFSFRD